MSLRLLCVFLLATSACAIDLSESAAGFMGSARYRKLHVEIDYDEGAEPPAGSLQRLEDVLSEMLDKPGGVTLELQALAPRPYPPFGKYTADEQLEIGNANRNSQDEGDTASMYFLFLYGYDAEVRTAGGRVVAPSVIVMFGQQIEDLCRSTAEAFTAFAAGGRVECGTEEEPRAAVITPQYWMGPDSLGCERLTSNIMTHEFGHVLGLVDLGTPMIRAHEDDTGLHCGEPNCLMQARDDVNVSPCAAPYQLRDFGPECDRDLRALRWSLQSAR